MSDNGFWNADWMETQQKYWRQWTDLSMKAMDLSGKKPTGDANPWEQAIDHWWQAVAPATPDAGRDFVEKMLEQGRHMFRLSDEFTRNLGAGSAGTDWSAGLEKTLADLQSAFGAGLGQGDDALHKMMAFWEMPFDNWQRMVSSLSLTPGDALRNMPHDQVKEGLNRFLSAPGLGYTREEQGQYQALMRSGMEYEKALQEYAGFFSNLGIKSVEHLRAKLGELSEQDKVVDSARGLYDLWVGCCEEVYAEQVMTPEYARIHGRLVNALMALKQRLSIMVDETLGALNMPTRSEVRTLQDRLQETRRENKALRRDLEELKARIDTLGGAESTATAQTSPKTAPRRKTVAKKTAAKPADKA